MASPSVRSLSNLVVSFKSTLTLPVSAASPGDALVVYLEGVDWTHNNGGGSPVIPDYIKQLYLTATVDGFKFLGYGKVPPQGLSGGVTFKAGSGQTTSGGWWGHIDIYSDIGWLLPGWLQTDATPGTNYATYTRADLASVTGTYSLWVQAEFAPFAGTVWFTGWANGDMGFGINTSLQPIAFINNTLGNPIGNVAANAAIPGFVEGKKVWLRFDIAIATGNCSYYYSYDPTPYFGSVFWHWTQIGTTVAGTNGGTTPRVTNSDTVFIGARDATTNAFGGKIFTLIENVASVPTLSLNFSDAAPAGLAVLGTANHLRSTDQNVGDLPFDNYNICDGICFVSDTEFSLPSIDVAGTDRLAAVVLRGGTFNPHTTLPVTGPADWTVQADRAAQALGLRLKYVTRTRATDADLPAAPVTADGNYPFQYHWFSFVGRQTVIALPPTPLVEVMQLGCADSYTVWVTDRDYATTIDKFGWTQIQWERVLDDVSEARVVIPDELGGVQCVARLGGLEPWAYGLLIERNDQEVWRGPVRNVQRQERTIVVSAADALARSQKRFAIRDLVVPYVNADAGLLFADIINMHMRQPADVWLLECPMITVNVPVTRTLRPRAGKMAWDLLSELLDTAVDAYMMNGVLYVWEPNGGWRYTDQIKRTLPGPYNDSFELIYGTFTEDSFSVRPNWAKDGAGQGTFVLSATTDTGELGFRQFEIAEDATAQDRYGVLDLLDPSPLEVPEDQSPSETSRALKARAQSLLQLRSMAPVVMESGILSRNAPIDVANLRPGALWVTDIYDSGYGQLLSVVRLRRVSVTVTRRDGAIEETVSPTLYPPGWSGDMGKA
jgi:hypothetical protein